MKEIVGIDLGLSRTAMCVAKVGRRLEYHIIEPPNGLAESTGAKNAARLSFLSCEIVEVLGTMAIINPADVSVWIEAQAYGIQHGASEKDLAELHGVVKVAMHRVLGTGFHFIPASEARKAVLGAGMAPRPRRAAPGRAAVPKVKTKDWVASRLKELGVVTELRTHDELDALVMADFGSLQENGVGILKWRASK